MGHQINMISLFTLPPNLPEGILGFQNDILTVLKAIQHIEIARIDMN